MNSHIENAICVTTWDHKADRPSPASIACGRWTKLPNQNATFDPDTYGEDSFNQIRYRAMRGEELKEDYNDDDTRTAILDEIEEGNFSWMNAGLTREETIGDINQDDENNYNIQKILNFKYEKVHSLYQFSENLELWSKGVQNYVRTNPQQFFARPVGQNAAANMGEVE